MCPHLSDLSSLCLFLVSSLYFLSSNNNNKKRWGKKPLERTQREKPSIKLTMDFVSLTFFLPMARRWDALSTEDPCPFDFPLPTTFRLPDAPQTPATCTRCRGPTPGHSDGSISVLEVQPVPECPLEGPEELGKWFGWSEAGPGRFESWDHRICAQPLPC